MGLDRVFATLDEQEQRAALRDALLDYGRLIGWPARTTIVFTEQLVRRPWKRCTRAQLSAVLEELHTILRAFESRQQPSLAPGGAVRANGGRRARRNGHAPRD